MKISLIFSWLLSMGFVLPMEETNEGREMYILYVIKNETEEVFAYQYAYKEEILGWIENGTFEYESDKDSMSDNNAIEENSINAHH